MRKLISIILLLGLPLLVMSDDILVVGNKLIHASGSVIVARETAPWTPALLTNTVAWYDAQDLATITTNVSGVTQWDDKSGNGNDVTQGTASAQPSYSATNFNGYPSLTFDGSPDKLVSTLTQLTNQTFACVIEATLKGVNNNNTLISAGSGFAGTGFMIQTENYGTSDPRFIGFYQEKGVQNAIPGAKWNGASGAPTVFEKGVGVLPCTGIDTENKPYVIGMFQSGGGSQDAYKGKIAEIIITDKAESLADRQRLEGYLAWKWGLESKLPESHPYRHKYPTSPL